MKRGRIVHGRTVEGRVGFVYLGRYCAQLCGTGVVGWTELCIHSSML
jgi:hypothetical protein